MDAPKINYEGTPEEIAQILKDFKQYIIEECPEMSKKSVLFLMDHFQERYQGFKEGQLRLLGRIRDEKNARGICLECNKPLWSHRPESNFMKKWTCTESYKNESFKKDRG